jgi:hypothetical protein
MQRLTFASLHGLIFLEVDQGQHKFGYTVSDYSARMSMIEQVARHMGYRGNIAWIRYNPDAFKVDGATRKTTQQERKGKLVKLIDDIAKNFQPNVQDSYIYYLFYDSTTINGRLQPGILQDETYDEECLENVVFKKE